jgi:hypothetical protein
MTIERQHIEATQGEKIRAQFHEIRQAELAVDRLQQAGFNDDQITLTTHGGRTEPDGTFVRGAVEVVVLAADRGDEAERILSSS